MAFMFGLLMIVSCQNKQERLMFQLVEDSGINFINKVVDDKQENCFLFRNFYNGGGVGIGDINNDGLPDVFMTANTGGNKLFLNKGNFKFEDISIKANILPDDKWYTGVVLADINSDGWLDIYVCSSGHMGTGNRKNKLYINNHKNGFADSAAAYGLDISAYTTQVSFFDYDLDGDLDCFMINNSPIPVNQLNYSTSRDLPENEWKVGDFLKGGGDHLFRNDGGHFTEVTKEAGIHGGLISFGLGVSVSDVNEDGYPDVYVSNDSYERDYLYINQKNGLFKDEFENCMQHTSMSSMGTDIADVNNDGAPDIFSTDMLPEDDYRLKTLGSFDNIDLYRSKQSVGFYQQFMQNCLQVNNRNGKFSETAFYSGVAATDWSWGALMFDADNDGLNDIYVCNGVNHDLTNLDFMDFFANDIIQKMILTGKKKAIEEVVDKIPIHPMANKAYKNLGNLKFQDAGTQWGFETLSFSNGAAYGDLDNDGDLDLIVNNENQPAFIYKNNAREINKNNYIAVSLKGKGKNTFAIGSVIKIYSDNQVNIRELIPSRGFQSSVDYTTIVGLGFQEKVDSMVISWPDRGYSVYQRPTVNKLFRLDESVEHKNYSTPAGLFTDNNSELLATEKSIFDRHRENDYTDFYYERNIPEMLSREGPKAATGDVNGDGLEDIFIAGAAGQGGQLYLQDATGAFVKKEESAFRQFDVFEDVAVLFFDCDKDGDLDLFVGAGGNNKPANSREMQHRLFKNDGKGNFTIDISAFPQNDMNVSVCIAYDFDGDGDEDLFTGSRSVPVNYGFTPQSYIYLNDGNGHFTDIAKSRNPDISKIGMVTGAVWADITGDQKKELIIVGEWMAPRIFSYKGDHFAELKSNLNELPGWWQTIAAADLNKDGKIDLVLGNIGENFYLNPDKQHPVKLWINDFNQNGMIDKILTRSIDGKDKPVFLKHEMQDQVPSIKKENLKHSDYALRSINELFDPELLKKSIVREISYMSSCVAINSGNGQFSIEKLPAMTQLSSLNAVYCTDLNNDGNIDLVAGGNKFNLQPQFGRLDASYGHILINRGDGKFTWLEPGLSGLDLTGEIRDIVSIPRPGHKSLLFLRNNDFPALYELNKTADKISLSINR
jgi:hypothetical protein